MSSNEKKAATLGIPHGTAVSKLRKNIMFFLLCRLNENVCYRCKKAIQTVDEISIEHIKPWEGISADLFWDLQNIAFSHIACNRPHRIPGPKIVTPEGTAWCSKHQKALPIADFYKVSTRDDGLSPYCKSCQRELDTRKNHAKKVSAGA